MWQIDVLTHERVYEVRIPFFTIPRTTETEVIWKVNKHLAQWSLFPEPLYIDFLSGIVRLQEQAVCPHMDLLIYIYVFTYSVGATVTYQIQ